MKWVIDAHYAREHALRFEFGEHCFNRLARTGQGKRTGAVECGDRNRAIMFVDQRLRFFFAEADREHLSFAPGATLHELGAERGNARALFQGTQTCHTGCGNSRPMAHHCGPCPLITKATRGADSGRGVNEVRTFTLSCLIAKASSS